MKNKLLFAALLLMICNVALAQRFNGGILAGLNASQVEGDIYRGYHKPGILGGFYVETDLAPAVFMGMEIKYAQKGS
ncbi:MAG TPA: hypothetical protein P5210_16925, partial [Draconibacterium sp.]|nr:hypothetical protein [Draconibacterium sp.]